MDRETTEEIKRHFNVVAESLRSEIRAVAESQAATNERLDHLEAHLEARIVEESSETRAMIRPTRFFRTVALECG